MAKAHILIVEDDASLAEVLDYNLTQEGYETQVADDGQQGLREIRLRCPDLVILDLMLPMIEGLEVCRLLRADPATSGVLVLMLTARSEESDELVGFSVGADDYVTKPFSVKVLLQRINALLRRKQQGSADRDVLVSQGIMIDRRRHRATAGDRALELTPSEFGLLTALVRQPGRAFTRTELIDVALGDDALVLERTIDVHIRALRKKLGPHADLIQTVRGIGYRLRDPADVLSPSGDSSQDVLARGEIADRSGLPEGDCRHMPTIPGRARVDDARLSCDHLTPSVCQFVGRHRRVVVGDGAERNYVVGKRVRRLNWRLQNLLLAFPLAAATVDEHALLESAGIRRAANRVVVPQHHVQMARATKVDDADHRMRALDDVVLHARSAHVPAVARQARRPVVLNALGMVRDAQFVEDQFVVIRWRVEERDLSEAAQIAQARGRLRGDDGSQAVGDDLRSRRIDAAGPQCRRHHPPLFPTHANLALAERSGTRTAFQSQLRML